jgi:spore coat protein SA
LRFVFGPLLKELGEGDLVWCHNQPFFAAALEKEIHKMRAKLVYHAHDGNANYAVRNAFGFFTADAYIFVSNALRERWLSLFPGLKSTYAIHNGADEELFYPQPEEAKTNDIPVILYVGRLNPEKGVHVLIEAMKILEQRGVKAVCRIVGAVMADKDKTNLYKKTLFESRPSCVRFEGRRSAKQIGDEYRSADILCCPSVWQEPFGNVNIEAMACGIPVAASRVGGIPEIASEGGVILVEPNCAVELADALQKLAEDKVLRATVAAEGLSSFRRRFTWAAIFKQYQEVTDDLCREVALATE